MPPVACRQLTAPAGPLQELEVQRSPRPRCQQGSRPTCQDAPGLAMALSWAPGARRRHIQSRGGSSLAPMAELCPATGA
eukprot:4491992-Pyramimonas_sp.AAC.1